MCACKSGYSELPGGEGDHYPDRIENAENYPKENMASFASPEEAN